MPSNRRSAPVHSPRFYVIPAQSLAQRRERPESTHWEEGALRGDAPAFCMGRSRGIGSDAEHRNQDNYDDFGLRYSDFGFILFTKEVLKAEPVDYL